MAHAICGANLYKCYGDFAAVKGISFRVEEGQCFGFLGANGAGKTSTIRMICGFSRVDKGELWVLGESVRLTPPHIKRMMGVVPQEDSLDPDLSVMENLEVYGGYFGLSRHETRRRGEELLAFMGLEDKRNAAIDELSGGLKRRLMMARALINQPRLVILDEPTTGLDPQARRLVWQKLRQLKQQGVTLILTTHYMEEAAQLCDRLVILDSGEILAEGSPEELVSKYVLPYCIEVRMPLDRVPAGIEEKVRNFGGEVERISDGLYFFTRNGEELWQHLDGWGLPQYACYLRPTHLEDVFLKLTGKRVDQ